MDLLAGTDNLVVAATGTITFTLRFDPNGLPGPFNNVANVETPTLVMGGEDDWNVPILNSEQLYQALRRRGVETQLVVYPGQSHGIRVPSYQVDRYERYLAWYDEHVRGVGRPISE